jgi:glycosyltransferase involved in cell wall biosynthesis
MKQSIFAYALFFNVFIHTDPILVAVLMVKNEAPVIEMTLQPLVDAGITDFLIYDTGSTDTTIQITQDFFISNNITNFVIEQGEWIDFATSRNRALELTEQHFPNATFMIMLDAEWILHNGTDLLKYCKDQQNSSSTLYLIQLRATDLSFYHPRLIRTRSNIQFVGKVHEQPNILAQAKVPNYVYFEFAPTSQGAQKSDARCLRDRDLLLQELQQNPTNGTTVFFLAHTYFCLHDIPNAIKWFEHRTVMSGYDEENFLTFFSLAHMYHISGNFEKMIYNYLKAYNLRPHRAEPLIRLAQYFYEIQNYHLCYLFARHACTITYPADDISLVEPNAYNFVRYALLSGTAHIVGDYNLGQQATLKALQARPDQLYLQKNLEYYQTMLT